MLEKLHASKTFPYTVRVANQADVKTLATLTTAFHRERAEMDPTRTLKFDFDFERYVRDRISQPLHYYWVLERCDSPGQPNIVGFLFICGRDEAPPNHLPAT